MSKKKGQDRAPRARILGALVPTLDSDIFAQTIDAIETRLADLGFSLVAATTVDDRDVAAQKAQALLDIGIEGLFLSGVTHNDRLHDLIDRAQVPAIVISFFFTPAFIDPRSAMTTKKPSMPQPLFW